MSFDIDLDFGDRNSALAVIQHVPATMSRRGRLVKHTSGVYTTAIPQDPVTGWASLDYVTADQLGYFKFDFLNVGVYQQIRNADHLDKLMNTEPQWDLLQHKKFTQQLIHIGKNFSVIQRMPEPVNTIPRLAMLLAIIRPGKKHLQGLPWVDVAKTVWDRTDAEGYTFRHSHAIAYSHLVVVHMNLISEKFTKAGAQE